MVTAGVFMVARLSPLFELAPNAQAVVMFFGATTAFFAAVSILPGLGYIALLNQIRLQNPALAHASWGKQIASVLLYLTAIPVAYYRPAASLALIAIVAVLWLLPPKAAVTRSENAANLRD
jgi:hypothetical protein